jgi:hypothetical protein
MSDFASGMLMLSLFLIPVESLIYLIWAGIRGFRPSLKFDALWAMGLSWPGLLVGFSRSTSAVWLAGVLGLALLGCWAMAIAAVAGARVPRWFAWVPLIVMVVTATFWSFLLSPFLATYFGLGVIAWLGVCVSAVFSIRTAAREQAAVRPVLAEAPGFIWPT